MTIPSRSVMELDLSKADKHRLINSGIRTIQSLQELLSHGTLKDQVKGAGEEFVRKCRLAVLPFNLPDSGPLELPDSKPLDSTSNARDSKSFSEQVAFLIALLTLGIALYWLLQSPGPEPLIMMLVAVGALVGDHLWWRPVFTWNRIILVGVVLSIATLTGYLQPFASPPHFKPDAEGKLLANSPQPIQSEALEITAKRPVTSGKPALWSKIFEDLNSARWGPVQPVINDEEDAIPPKVRSKLNEQRQYEGYEPPHVDRFHFASPILGADTAPLTLSLSKNLNAWICVYVFRIRRDGTQELIRGPSYIGGTSAPGEKCLLDKIDEPVQILVCVFPLTEEANLQLEDAMGLYPCAWSDNHIELCAAHAME